jgi:hypothetical protein
MFAGQMLRTPKDIGLLLFDAKGPDKFSPKPANRS